MSVTSHYSPENLDHLAKGIAKSEKAQYIRHEVQVTNLDDNAGVYAVSLIVILHNKKQNRTYWTNMAL